MKLKLNLRSITVEQLKNLSFVLFFCSPLIIRMFESICFHLDIRVLAKTLALIVIYFPTLLLLLTKKIMPLDFLVLWFGVVFFILVTYKFHPEYDFWYRRNYYGIWDYVLRPDNGIYTYFFIRLVNEPKEILKNLKIASWIMYPYYAYLLIEALTRGYWETTGAKGQAIKLSYDLSFGYDVLFFTLVFLYFSLERKKVADVIMSLIGITMIVLGGSRGPLLCIAIFVAVYLIMRIADEKLIIKLVMAAVIGILGLIVYSNFNHIINIITNIMEQIGFTSRTLMMLLEGNVADDNGRQRIWNAAIQMIKDNPLGYGALGTRHIIYNYHDVGHCHQIFLEILVDFGVIIGGILILFFLINTFRIFTLNTIGKWRNVFLIFFARAFQLMLSGTYWHVASFWGCLGTGMAIYFCRKRKGLNYLLNNIGLINGRGNKILKGKF